MVDDIERTRFEKLCVLAYEKFKMIEELSYKKDCDIFVFHRYAYSISIYPVKLLGGYYFNAYLYKGKHIEGMVNNILYNNVYTKDNYNEMYIDFLRKLKRYVTFKNMRIQYRKKDFL